MFSFSDICDTAFLITSTVTYTRFEHAKSELHRVGIHDFRTVCDAPSAYYDFIFNVLYREYRMNPWMRNHKSSFIVTMSHYNAISQAYHTGSQHALFMEDDICFLRSIDEISEILHDTPKDADLILYDHSGHRDVQKYTEAIESARRQNIKFIPLPCDIRLATCYLLSRAGMKNILDLMNPLKNRQIYHNDRYFNMEYWKQGTAFIAIPPPAFQRPFDNVKTNSPLETYERVAAIREQIGVPLERYNMTQHQIDTYRHNAP